MSRTMVEDLIRGYSLSEETLNRCVKVSMQFGETKFEAIGVRSNVGYNYYTSDPNAPQFEIGEIIQINNFYYEYVETYDFKNKVWSVFRRISSGHVFRKNGVNAGKMYIPLDEFVHPTNLTVIHLLLSKYEMVTKFYVRDIDQ